jgi:hypothetical protein
MISYAALEEVRPVVYNQKRPPLPPLVKEDDVTEEETECYYVSVVFICLIIIISLSDILKNK